MVNNISTKVGVVHNQAIGETPGRQREINQPIKIGRLEVEGNRVNRKLLPMGVQTSEGVFTIVVADNAKADAKDAVEPEVDCKNSKAGPSRASTGFNSPAQAKNEAGQVSASTGNDSPAQVNNELPKKDYNIKLNIPKKSHSMAGTIPHVCSSCWAPYSSREIFEMHECFSNETIGVIKAHSNEKRVPLVANYCVVCENIYGTTSCDVCCKRLTEVWRQEEIRKASAVYCPLKWCRKQFQSQEEHDQHSCGPMTTGAKGKTTPGSRSTRKRANLVPKEAAGEANDDMENKNKKKKENIPSFANKPTKGTGGYKKQNKN